MRAMIGGKKLKALPCPTGSLETRQRLSNIITLKVSGRFLSVRRLKVVTFQRMFLRKRKGAHSCFLGYLERLNIESFSI